MAVCHAKTRDLAQFTILADILILAAGEDQFDPSSDGLGCAVAIDVGFNQPPDGRLVGDVDSEGVRQKASYITTVPVELLLWLLRCSY